MTFLQSIFDRIMKSMAGFFSFREMPVLEREPFSFHEPEPEKKQPRKRKEPELEIDGKPKETLAELLDHLDQTFATLRLSFDRASWLHHDSMIGLRRMGTYIPHPWLMWWEDDKEKMCVDVTGDFPALMSLSMCVDPSEKRETIPANTMFAIKLDRLPVHVSQHPGIAYQFGASYKFSSRNFWATCHLTVDRSTGEVTICDELRCTYHTVPHKRGRKHAGASDTYSVRRWDTPAFLVDEGSKLSMEERKLGSINMFVAMLNWWRDRGSRWSVAVKQGKDRAVFAIEPQNTKTYFADRDKKVKTASGQTKKIIHYVREHERIRDDKVITVREHIRGLREFDWGKYHCVVTAPKFHKTILTSSFDIPGVDEDDVSGGRRTIHLSQVGRQLADLEEADMRRKKPAPARPIPANG